eukprot:GEZU01039100.1.p1 GENE.GEZU01039100.1~~GEZU01039100.1.p1  ORF type:complete len:355 (-),score=105.60 GEZU01039100.1:104-1114(-)
MRAIQVPAPGADFVLVEIDVPTPKPNEVLIKVYACGVCHSDVVIKHNFMPGITYPRIPGHEVAGVVVQVGSNVVQWKPGDRVGVGWHGGHCFHCNTCRAGDFLFCDKAQVCGLNYDGGYAEYMVAPQEALAAIPDNLSFVEAAPMMCAGVTTYNALRNSGARPGDVVAIQGIGGLGHLGVQFAHKMGFRCVALSQSPDKEELAKKLGADLYVDQSKQGLDPVKNLGGAKVILATAPHGKSITELIPGLAPYGKLVVVGITDTPIQVPSAAIIARNASVVGWASGTAKDSQDTMEFAALTGVRSMSHVFGLEQANEAYEMCMNNKARFRCVLKIADE